MDPGDGQDQDMETNRDGEEVRSRMTLPSSFPHEGLGKDLPGGGVSDGVNSCHQLVID